MATTPEQRVVKIAELTRRWRKGEITARECDDTIRQLMDAGPPALRVAGPPLPEIQTFSQQPEVDE